MCFWPIRTEILCSILTQILHIRRAVQDALRKLPADSDIFEPRKAPLVRGGIAFLYTSNSSINQNLSLPVCGGIGLLFYNVYDRMNYLILSKGGICVRRIVLTAMILGLVLALSLPVWAAASASGARVDAVLDTDGSCQVTVSATLHLDAASELSFPVPKNARGISLNGSGVSTRASGDQLLVDLSRLTGNTTGDFSIVLRYTVPNTVSYNEQDQPQLELALLCGFSYPIDRLDFSLTLPEQVQSAPHFTSGYHQQSIEEDIVYEVSGNQLSGSVSTTLKDHELLSLSLVLTEATFPRSTVEPWSAGWEDTVAFVLMGLAALYWLIFLRCAPHLRKKTALPPDGSTAGELRCALTGQGADLTMMVMSWAQLGYILIHSQPNGRVVLHKRMEMGNERGAFEVRVFRSLFGKKRSVDGSGYHYARLCRKVAASRGSLQELFRKTSGNPLVFRVLAAAAGVFGGTGIAIGLAGDALLAFLIILLMSIVGGVAAWLMQNWVQGLHLRDRGAMYLAFGIAAVWIALGILAGEVGMAIGMVAFQLLAGLAWAYGGRRTPIGRQTTSQILGLRAYLKKLPPEDLERIERTDPDHFFTMAPYALALGVETAFARQFGRKRLNPCPWLTSGMDGHMTALEWSREMRRAADSLDEHQKRLPWEQLLGR